MPSSIHNLKPLPLGIQTFSKIIEGGYVYVDKTRLVYDLVFRGGVYFLSRPRRFGKSLLVDTLHEVFKGNREIFKGLWIYDSDYDWQPHPVIKISFGLKSTDPSSKGLLETINYQLDNLAQEHGIQLGKQADVSVQLADLIVQLKKKYSQNVVVLVDEYDKPILDRITKISEAEAIRDILRSFYGVLKDADQFIRFIFLTGVTKFSKMSVFSGLNNLTDLTMSNQFATLTGLTIDEIEQDFAPHLEEMMKVFQMSKDDLIARVIHWYNGYRFSDSLDKVINPYSFLSFLFQQRFQNFWFETGTPTFLIRLLQENNYDLNAVVGRKIGLASFSSYDIGNLDIIPLLLQTGYLTIQEYNAERDMYTVDLPNYEVEHSFYEFLLEDYAHIDAGTSKSYIYDLTDAVEVGDVDGFMAVLKVFYANIPYDIQIKSERYYQSLFFAMFKLIGLNVHAEVRTNEGRIDAVVENKNNVFIFEFKLGGTADDALEQIREKGYVERYRVPDHALRRNEIDVSTAKKSNLYLIGVGFDMEKRRVSGYVWEKEVGA